MIFDDINWRPFCLVMSEVAQQSSLDDWLLTCVEAILVFASLFYSHVKCLSNSWSRTYLVKHLQRGVFRIISPDMCWTTSEDIPILSNWDLVKIDFTWIEVRNRYLHKRGENGFTPLFWFQQESKNRQLFRQDGSRFQGSEILQVLEQIECPICFLWFIIIISSLL